MRGVVQGRWAQREVSLRLWAVLGLAGGLLAPGIALADATQPGELDNALVRSDECEYCHSFNNAPEVADDPLYAPYFTWRGSMMANAARDPVFWAGVAIASQDAEDPAETEACVRCHAPRAFLEGRGDAIAQSDLLERDLAGVECELCHRMVEDEVPGNGHYSIDDTVVDGIVPRRGPWAYPEGGAETPPPPHEWIQDDFVGSSGACGTCHDVTTDRERVDLDGNPMGIGFGEQRTFSEWSQSALAQPGDSFASCQDCHMPAVDDMPGCRDHVGQHHHETGGRRHDLIGANRFMVEMFASEASVLDSVAFDHTLEQMDAFVQTAATLEVDAPDGVDLAAGLQGVTVTVTNNTGHKLPTGYSEGRVMWLELEARLGTERIGASGIWDAEAQSFAQDEQLRTYRASAEEYATGESFHLLRNNVWTEDTRIPPRGLQPSVQTDPVGDRYVLQADGTWPHVDTVTYGFAAVPELVGSEGTVEVRVRLLYLINTPAYIDFLAEENQTNAAGAEIAMRFDERGGATPLVLAEQTVEIPIVVASGTTGTSTDAGDVTGSESGETSSSGGGVSAGTSGPPSATTAPEPSTGPGAAEDDEGGSGGGRCGVAPDAPTPAWAFWLPLLGWCARRRGR